jgi:hypothetical protein
MKHFLTRFLVAFIIVSVCSSFIYGIFGKRCGIRGYVYEVKGNQMPSPDEPRQPPKGIKTEVYIYELTGPSQVEKHDRAGFYRSVSSRLVKKTATNSKGYFSVKLKPGTYSVFTKTDSLLYANMFDQNNNIYPVEVVKKKMTDIVIKQDFNAAY